MRISDWSSDVCSSDLKRWGWVKKGVPLILEIGGRDAAGGQVSMLRRDRLWNEAAKANFQAMAKDDFLARAVAELEDIQSSLYEEARARRDGNITRVSSFDEIAARSEAHTSDLQSLMRTSFAVFC